MVRHFIYQKGRSEKFWSIEIGVDSKPLNTAQGQGRGEAESEKQAFEFEELCQKKIESLVQTKLKEGYEEVLLAIKDVNPFDLKDVANIKKQKGERLSVRVHGSSKLLEEICFFDWLKHLELRDLTTLSDSLGNLKNLNHLEIKESRSLESIPEFIGKLQTLTWLSIEYTAINSLPHSNGLFVVNPIGLGNARTFVFYFWSKSIMRLCQNLQDVGTSTEIEQ